MITPSPAFTVTRKGKAALAAYKEIARMTDTEAPAKPRLDALLSDAAPERPDGQPRGYEMRGSNEPDSVVRGWIVGELEHEGRDGRYWHLRLYETASGGFVAAMGNRSRNPGEVSFWTVKAVTTVEEALMAWDATEPAKKLCRQMGWDIKRRIA